MTPPPHEVVSVPPPGHPQRQPLLGQCISVRIDVFVHEQQFSLDVEVDEYVLLRIVVSVYISGYRQDPTATHFLLRLLPSLTPIGTVRAYRVEGPDYYKLGRLAVLKPYRRHRFGRDLVLALHQWVRDDAQRIGALQPARVVCHSQLPVKGFYAK